MSGGHVLVERDVVLAVQRRGRRHGGDDGGLEHLYAVRCWHGPVVVVDSV
jgi:hypothetical protein